MLYSVFINIFDDSYYIVLVFFLINKILITLKLWTSYLLMLSLPKTFVLNSVVFTFKFIVLIALLVFIRGGIPRYRYDFLTKIGWIKFLSLVLALFTTSLLLNYSI